MKLPSYSHKLKLYDITTQARSSRVVPVMPKRYASRMKSGKSSLSAYSRRALSYYRDFSWIALGMLKATREGELSSCSSSDLCARIGFIGCSITRVLLLLSLFVLNELL